MAYEPAAQLRVGDGVIDGVAAVVQAQKSAPLDEREALVAIAEDAEKFPDVQKSDQLSRVAKCDGV